MTEDTYQQIEMSTQDESAICRKQKSRLPAVPNHLLQGKRTKRLELQAKHTCDSELARAIEKVALAILLALLWRKSTMVTKRYPTQSEQSLVERAWEE